MGVNAKGDAAVLTAMSAYLPSANMQDRGVVGDDRVDFLDGWFFTAQSHAAYVSEIVFEGADFPCDFGGPLDWD